MKNFDIYSIYVIINCSTHMIWYWMISLPSRWYFTTHVRSVFTITLIPVQGVAHGVAGGVLCRRYTWCRTHTLWCCLYICDFASAFAHAPVTLEVIRGCFLFLLPHDVYICLPVRNFAITNDLRVMFNVICLYYVMSHNTVLGCCLCYAGQDGLIYTWFIYFITFRRYTCISSFAWSHADDFISSGITTHLALMPDIVSILIVLRCRRSTLPIWRMIRCDDVLFYCVHRVVVASRCLFTYTIGALLIIM
jgi:hypothetical protein